MCNDVNERSVYKTFFWYINFQFIDFTCSFDSSLLIHLCRMWNWYVCKLWSNQTFHIFHFFICVIICFKHGLRNVEINKLSCFIKSFVSSNFFTSCSLMVNKNSFFHFFLIELIHCWFITNNIICSKEWFIKQRVNVVLMNRCWYDEWWWNERSIFSRYG